MSGGYTPTEAQKTRLKQSVDYLSSITDNGRSWPQNDFMNCPKSIPFKVTNSCVALVARWKWVGAQYLRMRALLTDHTKEFDQYKDLVRPEENKEIIFSRRGTTWRRRSGRSWSGGAPVQDLTTEDEKMPEGMQDDVYQYLRAPVPEGLPFIIQVKQGGGDGGFGMGGGVAGLVFTLWLVYNMGN